MNSTLKLQELEKKSKWEEQHSQFLWAYYVLIFLGTWLIANLLTFEKISTKIMLSDFISGVALIFFGWLSLCPKRLWAPWACCLIGVWLQLAPLFFWSPTAFGYLNDTVTGAAVIAFALLIPGTPGMMEDDGAAFPPGWSYNPSCWSQRLPIICLTCACWFFSRYMAAFQLGYIDTMWDPVFGSGTLNVITSSVSKAFPISDAGLGAFVYTMEALLGAKGGVRRWRTMPWMVALFGLLVIPAGLASIILIMLQPLLVGAWCFWCLLTAACMLTMIALTMDEVIATVQFLRASMLQGHSFWPLFWHGGVSPSASTPEKFSLEPSFSFSAGLKGISLPLNLIVSLGLGIWLLFHSGPYTTAVNIGHILGALTITTSMISFAEVARTARFFNVVLGCFCLLLPFFMHAPEAVTWKALVVGVLLVGFSIPKGKIKESYGTWQGSIR